MRGDGQVFKRGDAWWICYYHRGVRYRESAHTDNKRAAHKLLRDRLTDLGRGKTAAIVCGKVTFEQMTQAYLNDYKVNGKRTLVSAQTAVKHLQEFFGGELAVDIRPPRIREFIRVKQEERYSNASINRYLSALNRMFNLMIEDEVLEVAPKVPKLEENNVRQGTVGPRDFERLLSFLPSYLRLPIEFAYLCSWRKGEFRSLEWRDVNLGACEIRLRPENSKNKTARVIPLTGRLREIIIQASSQRRLDCRFVFHRGGESIGDFRKAWRASCKAASLDTLRVHDLRRSALTNMTRAGIDETTAMKISGHKTSSAFRRYQIKGTRDMAEGLERLDSYLKREGDCAKVVPLRESQ
jgi:integrase